MNRPHLVDILLGGLAWIAILVVILLWILILSGTAQAAVTITGPVGAVPTDRYVVLPITGAEVDPQVLLSPKTATAIIDISVGQPCVVFRATEEGTYELTVIASRARVIPAASYDRCLILVGDEDEEEEEEEEEEEDEDPPPVPADKLFVQVIEEKSGDRPHYTTLHSLKVEKWIIDNGHRIRRRDQHDVDDDGGLVVDPAPESVPVVRVYDDESGKLLWEGLPESEAEFLNILRKHCATCQPSARTTPRSSDRLDRPTRPVPRPAARRIKLFRR